MSLIQCQECLQEISSDAIKCPKCGKLIRKPKRSLFGKIVKWSFIAFNILMLIWLISGISNAGADMEGMSDAYQAGAAVGSGLAVAFIMILWVLGDILLGLIVFFTRPKL